MDIYPDLSVCIVTGEKKDDLSCFLRSMQDDDHLQIEVIIVNQHYSYAELADILENIPEAEVVNCPRRLSKPAVFNLALSRCRGRYLSFWSQESLPEKGCLLKLTEFLDENPDAGIAVPKLRNKEGQIQPVARNLPGLFSFLYPFGIPGKITPGWDDYASGEASWLTGPGLTINRHLLEEIGGFSEKLPALWPVNLCLRALKAGWHCFYRNDAQASADINQWLDGIESPGLQLWERLVVTLTRLRFIY